MYVLQENGIKNSVVNITYNLSESQSIKIEKIISELNIAVKKENTSVPPSLNLYKLDLES